MAKPWIDEQIKITRKINLLQETNHHTGSAGNTAGNYCACDLIHSRAWISAMRRYMVARDMPRSLAT